MSSDRKNDLEIPDSLFDRLDGFRLKVDKYEQNNPEQYYQHLHLPVFQENNGNYSQEVVAGIGFFKFCKEQLANKNSPADWRAENKDILIQSITTLRRDIALFSDIPKIDPADKKECQQLLTDLEAIAKQTTHSKKL